MTFIMWQKSKRKFFLAFFYGISLIVDLTEPPVLKVLAVCKQLQKNLMLRNKPSAVVAAASEVEDVRYLIGESWISTSSAGPASSSVAEHQATFACTTRPRAPRRRFSVAAAVRERVIRNRLVYTRWQWLRGRQIKVGWTRINKRNLTTSWVTREGVVALHIVLRPPTASQSIVYYAHIADSLIVLQYKAVCAEQDMSSPQSVCVYVTAGQTIKSKRASALGNGCLLLLNSNQILCLLVQTRPFTMNCLFVCCLRCCGRKWKVKTES